CARHHSGFDYW
nr:immunoglobulin heavy chain junction region [Macaca mulatta]MOX00605.1 immunoglobulin heavy chain junction region [Macaca mulatta]MOX02210.1 immunoglobulin heavy chain junction region [Macaca mulatta]MOX02552.1 immunoglobulin heavy chain junction region [Macaca mulatta]MOX04520.1 immunoglobulin heavy chain junction region [Macaca mulatta]